MYFSSQRNCRGRLYEVVDFERAVSVAKAKVVLWDPCEYDFAVVLPFSGRTLV